MTTDAPSRVFMISFAFPPTGGPGVQRSAKFATYLPEFGWEPIVWCADSVPSLPRDDSLSSELPMDLDVRAHPYMAAEKLPEAPVSSWRRWMQKLGLVDTPTADAGPHPDEFLDWAMSSIEPALDACLRTQAAVIYSTFSPASNHCLALELKLRTGLPWVADFRDLWTDDYRYRPVSEERCAADRKLQQRFLESADVVIGVTPKQTSILAGHLPLQSEKFVTITNGFDPADFEAATPDAHVENAFVVTHVGRLDRYRSHPSLFAGMSRFLQEVPEARPGFRFRVVGHLGSTATSRLESLDLPHDHMGYVPHPKAIDAMRAADVLLLAVPDGPNADSVIPAKLFEYLASGRPILVVGPEGGECERIVRETQSGMSVGFDEGAIAEALSRLYHDRGNGPVAGREADDSIRRYSRQVLSGNLADIFQSLSRDSVADTTPREADIVGTV